MENNFSMEWKKIARMEYEKIVFHSIPYHALLIIRISSTGPRQFLLASSQRVSIDFEHYLSLALFYKQRLAKLIA